MSPAQQRKADFNAMARAMKTAKPSITPPITFCNSTTGTQYLGADLLEPPVRMNAAQAFTLPSRVGRRLNSPCGQVTDLAGQPLPAGVVL